MVVIVGTSDGTDVVVVMATTTALWIFCGCGVDEDRGDDSCNC